MTGKITMKADGERTKAEVLIYDEISRWGVSASDFAREISSLDVDELDVRINSPGGGR